MQHLSDYEREQLYRKWEKQAFVVIVVVASALVALSLWREKSGDGEGDVRRTSVVNSPTPLALQRPVNSASATPASHQVQSEDDMSDLEGAKTFLIEKNLFKEPLRAIDLDLNKDGVISLAEWRQTCLHFDQDVDGGLSFEEAVQLLDSLKFTRIQFETRKDLNQDGAFDDNERFKFYQKLDENGDSSLDAQECRHLDLTSEVVDLQRFLDVDGIPDNCYIDRLPMIQPWIENNRILFRGLPAWLKASSVDLLDDNKNGFMDPEEIDKLIVLHQLLIKRFDQDGDGKLNDGELVDLGRAFSRDNRRWPDEEEAAKIYDAMTRWEEENLRGP